MVRQWINRYNHVKEILTQIQAVRRMTGLAIIRTLGISTQKIGIGSGTVGMWVITQTAFLSGICVDRNLWLKMFSILPCVFRPKYQVAHSSMGLYVESLLFP